jgi:hypothetical protein
MGKMSVRSRFFWWLVYRVLKYEEGKMLNLPLKVLHFIFMPLLTIHYQMQKHHGYQWHKNTWIIHGMEYSDLLFKHFAVGDDSLYRVIRRDDGIVTIQRVKG